MEVNLPIMQRLLGYELNTFRNLQSIQSKLQNDVIEIQKGEDELKAFSDPTDLP